MHILHSCFAFLPVVILCQKYYISFASSVLLEIGVFGPRADQT